MANFGKQDTWSGVAENDLSAARYRFVELSGDNQFDLIDGTSDIPFGVLQNKPQAGENATVAYNGVTKIVAGDTVTAGDPLVPNATGHATTAGSTAGTKVGAVAITGGASGSTITARLALSFL